MTINNFKTQTIQDRLPHGVYIWWTEDGYVGDDDDNYLCISSLKGDQKMIDELEKAVRYYGITGGYAEFRPGQRKVSDEEYSHQLDRLKWGLTPDPEDVMSEVDELVRRGRN